MKAKTHNFITFLCYFGSNRGINIPDQRMATISIDAKTMSSHIFKLLLPF